jgi:hypothetical protein
MEAAARDIIRPTKIGRQVPVGAPSDTLHWRGVTGRNPAESPSPPFRGERVELQARAGPVSRLRPRRPSIAIGQCGKPGYQSRFEPMTGTLETFVTLAAIQLAIRRLAKSRLLCQAPTVTNPRSILRHVSEGSASGIVGW